MTTAEFKALKVGDKVLVKGMSISFVTEDKIKTVTKIVNDRIELTDDRGFSGFVAKREMTLLDWYQVIK